MGLYKAEYYNLGEVLRVSVRCLNNCGCGIVRFIFPSDSRMAEWWNISFNIVKQENRKGYQFFRAKAVWNGVQCSAMCREDFPTHHQKASNYPDVSCMSHYPTQP